LIWLVAPSLVMQHVCLALISRVYNMHLYVSYYKTTQSTKLFFIMKTMSVFIVVHKMLWLGTLLCLLYERTLYVVHRPSYNKHD
jgi:hypothetical protein